jgi:DNA-binding CsgD family transcriptional regulator
MREMKELSELIAAIYDSVQTPEMWQTALEGAARFLSVKDVGLASYDFDRQQFGVISARDIDPDYVRSYAEYWGQRNFLWRSSASLPVGKLFSFDIAMPLSEFYRTGLYNEWFRPQGMDKALGANTLVEGSFSAVATVYRPSSRPDFSSRDVARFEALLPHLQRAMQMRRRLGAAPDGKADVFAVISAIEKAAILVDRNVRLLCANRPGEELIQDRSLNITRKGTVTAWNSEETGRLHRLVYSAANRNAGGSGGKTIVRREGRASLVLLVAPLPGARFGAIDELALIFADDPERKCLNPPDLDLLQAQYQLTPAEASLAILLLGGATPRSAAVKQNIAVSTARAHLARIFEKTGAHSQPELMRLLRRSGHDN